MIAGLFTARNHFSLATTGSGQKFTAVTIERGREMTRPSAHQYLYNKRVLSKDLVSYALKRDQIDIEHSWREAAVEVYTDVWFSSRDGRRANDI